MKSFSRITYVFCLSLLLPLAALAGTLTGVVRNGTLGRTVAGQDVILIQMQSGMQPVATVKTDTQGRFSFDRPELGSAPVLVRVVFRGVNYHQSVPPGSGTADVEVFEPNAPAAAIELTQRAIVFQPNGETLLVGEEFTLNNRAQPPATYVDANGTVEFAIPDGAQLAQVTATGPAGMPLTQGTLDKAKNRYAIAFPLKPGESTIRVSYQMPYTGNRARVIELTASAAQRILLAAPGAVQLAGEGFAPAGNEQGWNLYARSRVPAGTTFSVEVSGTAPPQAGGGTQQDPAPSSQSPANTGAETLPPRIASVQWVLVAGFALLFALGVAFLLRQPRMAVVGQATEETAPRGAGRLRKNRGVPSPAEGGSSARPPTAPQSAGPVAGAAASIDREVRLSLDEMKDTLFRLELRRQAGTISEEEYARERGRLETLLRGLVRG